MTIAPLSLRLSEQSATDEDLLRLARLNPGFRFERSPSGEVVVTPPAGSESSRRGGRIFMQVERWNEVGSFGYTFESSAGFRMPDGSVLSPDVSWVARARYDSLSPSERERFAPLCPDLAVEVASPSDDVQALLEKLARFISYGAAVAMLFDPRAGLSVIGERGTRRHGRIEEFTIPAGILAAAPLTLRFSDLYDAVE